MAILFFIVRCSHLAAPQITASFPILVPQQLASYHSFMAILFLVVCCFHMAAPQITTSFPILVPQQLASYHSFMAILFLIVCCSHMAAPQITASFPILVPQQLAATTVLWLFCFSLCVVPTWLHHKLLHPSQYIPFLNSSLTVVAII